MVSVEQYLFFRRSQTLDCRIDHSKNNMRRAGFKKTTSNRFSPSVFGCLNTTLPNFNTTRSVPSADAFIMELTIETSQLSKKCAENLACGHKVWFPPLSTQASLEPHVRVWTLGGVPWEHEKVPKMRA